MRLYHVIILITLGLLFLQCNRRFKVTYNIPAYYPEARKQEIIGLFNKGKELFKIHCAECHGVFTSGKEKVPNFSNQQLDNYSARYVAGDPKNHAVVAKMSPEQLNETLLFLRFKKTKIKDTTGSANP